MPVKSFHLIRFRFAMLLQNFGVSLFGHADFSVNGRNAMSR